MSNPIKLSGIILATNNEATIAASITHLLTICDEVVIADGGSTDRTVEIAESMPKTRVVHRQWDGNYPAQRNFAMDAAKGEWLLSLDTDELFGLKALKWIPRLIRIPGINWYSIPRMWLVEVDGRVQCIKSKPFYRGRQYRLLRNKPDIRYIDFGKTYVHEKLNKEAMGYGRPLRFIHMFHYDFLLQSREAREAKYERYMQLSPEREADHKTYLWEDLGCKIGDLPEPLPGDMRDIDSVYRYMEENGLKPKTD
ncbi:MAG: glycosyltransferase family 2 protein [Nevskiales bacterium]